MKTLKLINREEFERSRVIKFQGGDVEVVERESHDTYALAERAPRLMIIDDAFERTKGFIARSRSEFAALTSIMRELKQGN